MRDARQSVVQLDSAMLEPSMEESVGALIRIPTRVVCPLETATCPAAATQQQTVVEDGPLMSGNWEVVNI